MPAHGDPAITHVCDCAGSVNFSTTRTSGDTHGLYIGSVSPSSTQRWSWASPFGFLTTAMQFSLSSSTSFCSGRIAAACCSQKSAPRMAAAGKVSQTMNLRVALVCPNCTSTLTVLGMRSRFFLASQMFDRGSADTSVQPVREITLRNEAESGSSIQHCT